MIRLQLIYKHQPKVVRVTITEQQSVVLTGAYAAYHRCPLFKRRPTGHPLMTDKGSVLFIDFASIATLIMEEQQDEPAETAAP